MLLFSLFQSSIFGNFFDSAIHRLKSTKLQNIHNHILKFMTDDDCNNIFSFQNIVKKCYQEFGSEVGHFFSPIVVMNAINTIFKENPQVE